MNDQVKAPPVALNLMEIWRTGRQLERPNVLWRPVKADQTPAADWRPMNATFAKKALRSGVFAVTHEGQRTIFAAREFPRERLQVSDYARLKELIALHRRGEQLPPLVMGPAHVVPAEDAANMENVEEVSFGELGRAGLDAPTVSSAGDFTPEQLDAAADSVIADITGQAPADAAAASGDSPTPLSDGSDSLATDGGVSIPSVGDVAGATTEATHDEQQSDGGRESDRGSEIQGDTGAG